MVKFRGFQQALVVRGGGYFRANWMVRKIYGFCLDSLGILKARSPMMDRCGSRFREVNQMQSDVPYRSLRFNWECLSTYMHTTYPFKLIDKYYL